MPPATKILAALRAAPGDATPIILTFLEHLAFYEKDPKDLETWRNLHFQCQAALRSSRMEKPR